ncbi:MAG: homocysteine S-methyltransferase family protein [Negativicutes bacterium]|nr:homocysteine S-methyltransferase family protein [Negativicutes bacterium]
MGKSIKIFDGAMGTMLLAAGLPAGDPPELWNLTNRRAVTEVHAAYLDAGADIVETNTFGASPLRLAEYGLADRMAEINREAVAAARAAGCGRHLVAGSIGPCGQLINPLGSLSYQQAYISFHSQAQALAAAGVDYLLIETMTDIQEARIALIAARAAAPAVPVICQLSYQADGRTLTGSDPLCAYVTLSKLGAAVIGANCSLGPAEMLTVIETLSAQGRVPVSAQPNAGLPECRGDCTVFPMPAEEFAAWGIKLARAGATFIGGCCGTTPGHIAALKAALADFQPSHTPNLPRCPVVRLSSRSRTVSLGAGLPPQIIGERINPSGRKALAAAIAAGDFGPVRREALEQVRAGAGLLDVNMGVPGLDPAATMAAAVNELDGLIDVPLVIDTTSAAALEAGLQQYPGRALINSVSAEPDRMESFLPLAKRYGAAILVLPVTERGIPATAEERLAVAGEIVAAAKAVGLDDDDIVLDPLVLTVAADHLAALTTLATLGLYRRHLGYPTAMGLSNVSFGLPRRELLNSHFLSQALLSGLDAPIMNPLDPAMIAAWQAAAALLAFDPGAVNYSRQFASNPAATATAPSEHRTQAPATAAPAGNDPLTALRQAVKQGGKYDVLPLVTAALDLHPPLVVTEQGLTAAMAELGDDFAAGRVFLPQVLLAAETMRLAFEEIKRRFPCDDRPTMGTVVLATVRGDIHDLGKNIVAALLTSSNFTVIDLGKDVPPERIVLAIDEHRPQVVGLSALMTTTLPQVGATIAAIRAAGHNLPVIVGGAVLTAEYAARQGADYYAADAISGVETIKRICRGGR